MRNRSDEFVIAILLVCIAVIPMLCALGLVGLLRKLFYPLAESSVGNPERIFLISLGSLICGVVSVFVSGFLGLVGGILFLILFVSGVVFLLALLIDLWKKRRLPGVPRFQMWTQDMFLAGLCYALGLTAVARESSPQWVLAAAIYFFVSGCIGFLIGMDICRRSVRAVRPRWRAGFVVLIVAGTPVLFPLVVLAWIHWRSIVSRTDSARNGLSGEPSHALSK